MDGVAGVVQGAGDEAGGGGFADATDAGEHVGLRNAAHGEGIADGADHGVLANEVLKAAGTVLAGEHEVARARAAWGFGEQAGG